jgi:hypothetical protein
MIHSALTSSGKLLLERGCNDFGAFVLANLAAPNEPAAKPSAGYLVQQLVDTFPAFADARDSRGARRVFLKRAQLVATSLYQRFQVHTACSAP